MNYTVKPEEAGRKVRDILRRSMGVSYTAMKSAKWNGRILLNGEPVRADAQVSAGDLVSMDWAEDEPVYKLKPYDLPLTIPYLDEDILVVDKPAGIASQSSRNHPDDSLENALYADFGCPEHFVYRPVNRLDKGTGGLMMIARTPHAQHIMQRQLHTPAFRRRYLAWTDGRPESDEGVLNLPIAKMPGATVRRTVSAEGKPSRTRYRVLREQGNGALVLLELETGRTHQIRVHLSHIGCPVRGDFLYGKELPEEFPGCFALHSAMLEAVHPVTGETIREMSLPVWAKDIDPSVLFMDFN
uniref:Pseudouridine synthase n=1 Tax=uncultured bacterium Contig21 TaxID=1393535 RepID=W0FN41_9BACT|nr:RluA family pseudouridine synthase [uncultured bacterium Contig21]